MKMKTFDAVVLAGGGGDRLPAKALIEIAGRPMAAYVLSALTASPRLGRIVVVGGEALAEAEGEKVIAVPGGESLLDSLQRGLEALEAPEDGLVLIVSGDIPLLTPRALEGFLEGCAQKEGDFYYPVIPKEAVEGRFPGMRRTYVELQEGVFTGGNLVLVRPRTVRECSAKARQFIELRKNPFALGRLVGWGFLARLLLRRLTLEEAQRRISQLFAMEGIVVVSPDPELGVDVDNADDLAWIQRELEKSR